MQLMPGILAQLVDDVVELTMYLGSRYMYGMRMIFCLVLFTSDSCSLYTIYK